MSKNYPEPAVMSSNPDSPVTMDEPDFSGLMALTEASIRRKLSELKYPDADFSSSQNEDDADQKIISVVKNQPVSQIEPQNNGETKGKRLQESPPIPSASSNINTNPQSSAALISNAEQSKSAATGIELSNKTTDAKEIGDNSMNLVSALDDPDLVKIVSLGLKSSKTESELEQRVKYCGLRVELPIESKNPELRKSKSPELKKSCEKVNNDSELHNENKNPESKESPKKEVYVLEIHDEEGNSESEIYKSPEPEISSETIEETIEKETSISEKSKEKDKAITDIATERKTPTERLSPDYVKDCRLSVDKSPEIKITHTKYIPEPVEQESVVRSIGFKSESKKSNTLTVDEKLTDCAQKHSSTSMDEISETPSINVDYKVKELKEPVIDVIGDFQTMDKNDGEAKTATEAISETLGSDLSNMCQSSKENNETDKEIVIDKVNKSPALSATETVEKENLTAEKEGVHQNQAVVSAQDENAKILMAVSEEIGVDVDKNLAELEQKAASDVGDDVSENELGLVISGVCSTTEAMAGNDMQMMQVNKDAADMQNVKGKRQKPRKEPVHVQLQSESSHKPADENLHKEVTDDSESELMDVSDDMVMIDIDNEKSENDKDLKIDNNKTEEPVRVTNTSSSDMILKASVSNGNKLRSDSVDAGKISEDQVSKVRVETLIKDTENKTGKQMETTDSEMLNISNCKIDEKAFNKAKEQGANQINSESHNNSLDNVTVTDVVSLDTARKSDSAIPFQTNTELSALESMLMKVTPREPDKCRSEVKSMSKQEKNTNNSADNVPISLSDLNVKQTEIISVKDKTELHTINEGQMVTTMQTKEDEITRASDTCNSGQRSVQTKEQSSDDRLEINLDKQKMSDSEDNANIGKDIVNSIKSLSAVSNSESTKTAEISVTESNSLTEVGEMLMITNVRTISLDEEEKLTEEMTTDNNDQIARVSDALNEKDRSAFGMNNTSGLEANNLNQSRAPQTSTFELLPARSVSAEDSTKTHSEARKTSGSVDPARIEEPAGNNSSSNSVAGMPVIANTFTIKEEPIDYEPYGMPDKMVSSRAKQPASSQSGSYNTALQRPAEVVVKRVNTQPRSSSGGEQQSHPMKIVGRDGTMVSEYTPASSGNQFISIRKNTMITNREVIPLNSSKQVVHSNTQVIQKTINNAFQRQKSPVTVVRPAASSIHSYLMNEKCKHEHFNVLSAQPPVHYVNVSKLSSSNAVTAKNQTVKRHATGATAPSQYSHPSVVSVPAPTPTKPAPAPPAPAPHKFAMNLKTINIETVGIPMITEMIARKNPVPVYKPPPPPKSVLGNEKTKQTFPCYECGDTFYFTSSLEQHTYRCSMKISYKCEWCQKILDFTNKCQLLSHLRSHMNIDKNQAVPIHIKSDSIEIRTNFDDIIPGKEFKWFKIPEKENLNDVTEAHYLINATSNGQHPQIVRLCRAHECTECKLTFYKKDDRAKMIHFAPDKNVKPIFCGKCPMYLHNHCGIKAHRRLHEDIMNLDFLICPECGICYEGKMQTIPLFLRHLKTKCFHLSRFSTLKCSKCKSNCTSIEELRHHLTTQVEQYYKCNKCPMALKTLKSFKTHFKFKHVHEEKAAKDECVEEAKAKIIYRCHVCDTLIDDKEFLLSHIEKHLSELKEQAYEYYHCLQCGLIFFEKKSLVTHYKTHRQAASETFCTLCRTQRKDMIEYTQHILTQHIAPVFKTHAKICDDCGLVCVDEHKLRIHECHMKTFAFVVQGDKSAAASQKEQKTKSPRKEGKDVANREVKEKSRNETKETPVKDSKEAPREEEKDGEQTKSPQKQSPVKSENAISKYRPIMPKPSRADDGIPVQYELECPYCGELYSSNFRRIEHLRSHRKDNVFICPYCECINFKSNDELEYHENDCSKEANSDYIDPIPKHLSKKCPSCNYVYGGKNKRYFHIKAHRGEKVFICVFCDAMNFTNYPELRSHEVVCSALNKTTVKSTDKSPSTNKIKLKISKGKPSKTSSADQPTQYQLEYKCDDCGQCFSRKEKQEEHTRLEHGIHPCHLCGLMYESQTSLKKHLLISHEGKKCVYYCWVCKRRRKFFNDVSHLQKHFTMKHKYRVWDPAKAVPALPGMDTQDSKTPQPAKRRLETTPERPDTPVKKLRIMSDKGFKCAKCTFMSEERKDFQAHIKEHKTDDSVQCIECGLCFMVIPSLKKHLFMVHKVKDFDTYLKEHSIEDLKEPEETDSENESNDSKDGEELIVDELTKIEDPSEESEEDEGNPLECKVCYKKFETEHLMKSHMRVHGMAFIKKTRRSLCSAAKKQKLDNNEEESTGKKTSELERAKSVEKHSKSEKE